MTEPAQVAKIDKLITELKPALGRAAQDLKLLSARLVKVGAMLDAAIKSASTERIRLALKALAALDQDAADTARFFVKGQLKSLQQIEPDDALVDELAAVDTITTSAGLLKAGVVAKAAAIKRLQDKGNQALETLSKDVLKVSGRWAERFAEALANRRRRLGALAAYEKEITGLLEKANDAADRREAKALAAVKQASEKIGALDMVGLDEPATLARWLEGYDPAAVDKTVRTQLDRDSAQLDQLVRQLGDKQDCIRRTNGLIRDMDICPLEVRKLLRALGWPDGMAAQAQALLNLEIGVMLGKLEALSKSTDRHLSARTIHDMLRVQGLVM